MFFFCTPSSLVTIDFEKSIIPIIINPIGITIFTISTINLPKYMTLSISGLVQASTIVVFPLVLVLLLLPLLPPSLGVGEGFVFPLHTVLEVVS